MFCWPKAKYDPKNPDDDRVEAYSGRRENVMIAGRPSPNRHGLDAADCPERADAGEDPEAVDHLTGAARAGSCGVQPRMDWIAPEREFALFLSFLGIASARIKWMFTTEKARTKMGCAYPAPKESQSWKGTRAA